MLSKLLIRIFLDHICSVVFIRKKGESVYLILKENIIATSLHGANGTRLCPQMAGMHIGVSDGRSRHTLTPFRVRRPKFLAPLNKLLHDRLRTGLFKLLDRLLALCLGRRLFNSNGRAFNLLFGLLES